LKAYSTWYRRPSGENTVMCRSYPEPRPLIWKSFDKGQTVHHLHHLLRSYIDISCLIHSISIVYEIVSIVSSDEGTTISLLLKVVYLQRYISPIHSLQKRTSELDVLIVSGEKLFLFFS
jgi:hypothetical protein